LFGGPGLPVRPEPSSLLLSLPAGGGGGGGGGAEEEEEACLWLPSLSSPYILRPPNPMSSPPADDDEEEATDVQTEEEEWGDEALPGARVSAAADEDHSGETRTTCCVCMEPSTCSGAHRLWCENQTCY